MRGKSQFWWFLNTKHIYIYRKLELNKDSPKATKTAWCNPVTPELTFFQFRNPGFTKWSGIAIPNDDLCTLVI